MLTIEAATPVPDALLNILRAAAIHAAETLRGNAYEGECNDCEPIFFLTGHPDSDSDDLCEDHRADVALAEAFESAVEALDGDLDQAQDALDKLAASIRTT